MQKIALHLARCAALALVAAGLGANAQSPREQLQQMVEQLQKAPNDNALREKIIALAVQIKPPPAVPEEAQRRMARGTAAFRDAKTAADYRDAVREFEQATLAAPWHSDAYYNLGVAQDKAEQYDAALRNLRRAQLLSPESRDIRDLIYQVEYRNEKANSPAAREARRKAEEQEFLSALDGAVFDCTDHKDQRWHVRRWSSVKGSQLQHWQHVLWAAPNGGFSHLPLTPALTGADAITGRTTRVEDRTIVLEKDTVTFTREVDPFKGQRHVCKRRT